MIVSIKTKMGKTTLHNTDLSLSKPFFGRKFAARAVREVDVPRLLFKKIRLFEKS